ncbi:MAG TPA: GAF domain-containing protein [Planktothrix sp.]
MLDYESCDNEPVQFMDAIQGFGSLLVVDEKRVIVQVAAGGSMNIDPTKILGKSFDHVYPDIARIAWATLGDRNEPTVPILIRSGAMHQWLTCIAHKSGEFTIFELEPFAAREDMSLIKFKNDRDDSIESYLSFIVENLQAATGYDRVMAYKFATDWHGEVVAEALAPKSLAHSFSGHHFPASDIPAPARELFRKNWVRIIANVDEPTVELQSSVKPRAMVDLSRSALRAASPIHVDYLKIMGVKASMTMSLICDGKLWGLLACHHLAPKIIEAQQRSLLGLSAKLISSRITTLSLTGVIKANEEVAAFLHIFSESLRESRSSLRETVRDQKVALRQMIKSDGFAYINHSEIVNDGHMPSRENLHKLRDYLDGTGKSFVVTSVIADLSPTLSELSSCAAGIIAAKIDGNWFVWTRNELGTALSWAGNPDSKDLYTSSVKLKMSPRISFETWQQQSHGRSEDWQQSEQDAVTQLQLNINQIMSHQEKSNVVQAHSYLKVLRQSINAQAADLQKHFDRKDLVDMVEEEAANLNRPGSA